MGMPRPYRGIAPLPGTDVTKNLKFIYGHDDVAVWLMLKTFPPTIKYPPLVAIWFITFRRPEHVITQSGRVTSILGQDMFSPIKNDQQVYKRPSFVTLALFTSRSRWRTHVVWCEVFYAPQKPRAQGHPHIWADPAPIGA